MKHLAFVFALLACASPALAQDRGDDGHSGWDNRGGSRWEDRGGNRWDDRGGNRWEDRGGNRWDDRGGNRWDDRGGNRWEGRGESGGRRWDLEQDDHRGHHRRWDNRDFSDQSSCQNFLLAQPGLVAVGVVCGTQ